MPGQMAAKNANVQREEEYEVECLLDHSWYGEMFDEILYYLVKWKGYDEVESTWEREENTAHCSERAAEYWTRRKRAFTYENTFLENPLLKQTGEEKRKNGNKAKKVRKSFEALLNRECLDEKTKKFVTGKGQTSKRAVELTSLKEMENGEIRVRLRLDKSAIRRKQLDSLKVWEVELNELCSKFGEAKIFVENNLDFDQAPPGFNYICDYLAMDGLVVAEEPLTFCDCANNCNDKSNCCPSQNEQESVYSAEGRLTRKHQISGFPIYECNKKCACSSRCRNRVVQKGRKVPLKIVKTENKGWGVQTLENIKVGTFITTYVGELLTVAESERRARMYAQGTTSYLFDLDVDNDPVYTVDAKYYGNVAHFINHSCDPNMYVRNVLINCSDPKLPRLAFFATRDIVMGEELTFDYHPINNHMDTAQGDAADDSLGSSVSLLSENQTTSPARSRKKLFRMPCCCDSNNCKRILWIK